MRRDGIWSVSNRCSGTFRSCACYPRLSISPMVTGMQTDPTSRQHHYQLLKRGLAVAFFLLVAWLIYRYGRTLDWQKIWRSVQQIDRSTLLLAAACSIG
eukprot:gene5556-7094_t